MTASPRAPHTPRPPRAPLPASDQAAWSRVLALHTRVERELAAALQRRHGIGLSEYRSLEHLQHSQTSELRMQDLAERVGLGQSSVTRLVGRLEAAGFAVKDLCPSDKRGVYAVITEQGRARYEAARTTYTQVLSCALNTLTTDPELGPTVQALRATGPR
ncbi:MarR family winged helix-turn-helix transcriptional regulator [Streptomyces rubellomurinus]|uniref:MarR family transcriptional regulator n=1 Tax=Streptomyces rubellomurinus (strain ATCC 31215) TaxID=359131 RepID=A0A0F2T822_STRR3|nr:MarR family transcriptional regulator [Streptomyces rubellomurinus]KJS57887.1 MarR family transcriptional regulator [Streptomyces rubellomurinus]